jgi:hypothetical protein
MTENITQDVFCKSPLLDPSLFPSGSANFLNPNFNILPYLCQLLKVANDETIDPILVEPPQFDITPFTDFSGLASVGDPRASLGLALSTTFINFLPRIITQTELLQSGGSQIIDNYICDQDGNPIKESKVLPSLLSLDLSGNKPFKYGALDIPPINVALEELLRPITPEEIKQFVLNFVKGSRGSVSKYLITFLNTWFLFDDRWKPSLHVYLQGGFFFIKLEFYENLNLKDYQKSLYLKYHEDQKDEIGCALNLESVIYHKGSIFGNTALSKAMGAPIFDYKDIVSKPLNEQKEFYDILINSFVTLKAEEYRLQDLLNPNIPLTQKASIYASLTSQYSNNIFNSTEILSAIPVSTNNCSQLTV